MEPPLREKTLRTSAPVRLRLSVRDSTMIATPPGRVPLVGHRLVAHALELAGAPLDGPLDGVDRHRAVARLVEHGAQGRVGVEVAAPSRAATSSWRISLANSFARALSTAALRCLVVAHLECPDIGLALPSARSGTGTVGAPDGRRSSSGWNAATSTGALPAQHRCTASRAPCRRRPAGAPAAGVGQAHRGQDLHAGTGRLDQRGPDEDGVHRPAVEGGDVEVALEGLALAPVGVAPHRDVDGARSSAGRAGRRRPRRPAGSGPRRCRRPGARRRAPWPAARASPRTRAASTWWSTRRRAGRSRRGRRGRRAADRPGCRRRGQRARRGARRRRLAARGRRSPPGGTSAAAAHGHRAYQPRSARCVSRVPISRPGIAAPRPRLTLATICGVGVVGRGLDDGPGPAGRVLALEDARAHEHGLGARAA